jgi:choline dehydrogenase
MSAERLNGFNEHTLVPGCERASVTDIATPAVRSELFVYTAIAMGYDDKPDFNGHQQKGAGLYQLTVKDRKRHSAATVFLLPILQRLNLTITTGALVTRLLFEHTRTVGVEYLDEGTLHQVRVNQEVIVSAGAFCSPQLLLLPGIGGTEDLQSLGIPVVVDIPGGGKNLQDHVLAPITIKVFISPHYYYPTERIYCAVYTTYSQGF